MKKILVPTDFSEHSDYALEVAISIAKKNQAEIILLNALDYSSHITDIYASSFTNDYLTDANRHLTKLSNEKLKNRADRIKKEGIEVTTKNKLGFLHELIEETATESNANLVIMGTKGVTGFEEVFLGSNTEKVVRTLNIPVLTINVPIKDFDVKKVLFVNEFEGDIVGDNFQYILDFANFFDAEIHLVRINAPNDFMTTKNCMALMETFAEKWKLKKYQTSQYDNHFFEVGLLEAAQMYNADVIAMGTHGRKGLAHVFYGSLTEDAVNHLNTPILAFKIPRKDRKK